MIKTLFSSLANGERYQTISVILISTAICFLYSCDSTTMSLRDPNQKVSRYELQAEYDYITAQLLIRTKDLDRQDAIKALITDQAALFAETGTINPAGLITSVIAIFGIGAAVDNIRKRKVIANNLTITKDNIDSKT